MALYCSIQYQCDDLRGNDSNQIYASSVQDDGIRYKFQFFKSEKLCHETLVQLFCQTNASFLHPNLFGFRFDRFKIAVPR